MVRFKVTTLSQPATFDVVQVGVVVDAVYNIPCHLNESHTINVSVDDVGTLTTTVNVVVVDVHAPVGDTTCNLTFPPFGGTLII
jgi:hypothetical protein